MTWNSFVSATRCSLLFLSALNAAVLGAQSGTAPLSNQKSAPDLILYNGKLFTADPQHPRAEAIAIRGARILAVGSDAQIQPRADRHTKLIDLQGRVAIPGLNDAHAHLAIWPKEEVFIETKDFDPSWQELSNAIRKAMEKASRGAILSGVFGSIVFRDTSVDRTALDKLSPEIPILLGSFDGHAMILNSAALARLGIGESIVDPAGGRFERDPNGKLTGVAREYATATVNRRLAAITNDTDASAALHEQLANAARYGITTIQDMPTDMSPERAVRLLEQVPTTIRIRITRMNATTPAGPDYQEGASASPHPSPLIAVNGTKWLLDGVIFEGSLTPRADAAAKATLPEGPFTFAGLPSLFPPSVLDAMLRDSLRHNYQLQFHVFGRPAATELFEALKRTGGSSVWAGRRLRIEHGDGLTPDLIAQAKKMGVIISQQGTHLAIAQIEPSLDSVFLDRLRADHAQPLRSLLNAGIPVALGSDGPLNPWLSITGAITHPDRPDEAITREQALTAYTAGSAYAEFAEKDKGSLAPGKLADLAVLSQDVLSVPVSDLPNTHAVLTLMSGKVVYDAHVLALPKDSGTNDTADLPIP